MKQRKEEQKEGRKERRKGRREGGIPLSQGQKRELKAKQ